MLNTFLKEIPSIETHAYFNTGGASLVPKCVSKALVDELQYEFEIGRVNQGQRKRFQSSLENLRERLSLLISANSSELAITNCSTDGINIILWGLNFSQNDEILTTTNEHFGTLASISTLSRLKGVFVRFYEPKQESFNFQEFVSMISNKTKIIIVSHVFWETGYVVPVKEIIAYAHNQNILVLVDGAQAVGSLSVDMQKLNADFYTFPAHKWLHGPEGVGTLYIKESLIYSVNQTFVGCSSFKMHDDYIHFVPSCGSRRYEIGTRFRPAISGFISGLNWLCDEIGLDYIFDCIKENTQILSQMIKSETSFKPIVEDTNNILTIPLSENKNCKTITKELETHNIFVREIERLNAIRISVGFFNNLSHIKLLIKELKKYQ